MHTDALDLLAVIAVAVFIALWVRARRTLKLLADIPCVCLDSDDATCPRHDIGVVRD